MQRLLQKKLRPPEVSEESITQLEEKLLDFSVYLSEIQDEGLRRLLEFLFNYIVSKPKTTPQNRTIIKHFHVDPENEVLINDIRRVLYATRLIKKMSADKQSIEKVYKL